MPVSEALRKSADSFCIKYTCNFDFDKFESKVEEFTFLRPNGGWIDVYKAVFEIMYKKALEGAEKGTGTSLDAEAMLDDFEYTLIRPYAKENEGDIKHKPYVGMDRITRLEYLSEITKLAPSNPVELYTEKYQKGELSCRAMRMQAESLHSSNRIEEKRSVEVAGYLQALEAVISRRSLLWSVLHPFKQKAEKRDALLMKRLFTEQLAGGEESYEKIAMVANETFEGYQKVNARLEQSMANAKEEMNRKQKMSDAMKESLRAKDFNTGSEKASLY